MPKKSQAVVVAPEKRLKRWRSKCPQKVAERIGRAKSEDFKILKRGAVKTEKQECKFKIAGSTGNVYDVKIGKLPSCTCPDFEKREDACKHTLFVLLKVMKVKRNDELLYQKAFTSDELETMFQQMQPRSSRYNEDDIDELIENFAETTVEENGRFQYDNVRRLTGQPSERDRSTYRPFHWEKPPYRRYNY